MERHRSNDITSGVLHLIGAGLAVAVLVVLIVIGSRHEEARYVVGYSLYGSGLILLYLGSAIYHLVPENAPRLKLAAKRFDHAIIYVLIATTYTPIAFIVLSGGWRWSLFGIIWGLAALGAALRFFMRGIHPAVPVTLYVIMGWLIVIALSPLVQNMTKSALWLLVAGGVAYTSGVLFFALEKILPPRKYFWMHEIFHIFVLAGSALHTVVMFLIGR